MTEGSRFQLAAGEVLMLGIPLGLVTANAVEWAMHKYVLHGMGKKKGSFWGFHWFEHHRNSSRNGHIDDCYEQTLFAWNSQSKEALALLGGAVLVSPLFPVAPFFTGTLWYSAVHYYRVHKRAHQDPGWARENLPWHYDHHMGPDAEANWCVTRPWFDDWLGTRKPYVGTELERRVEERRAARRARRAQQEAAAMAGAATAGAGLDGAVGI